MVKVEYEITEMREGDLDEIVEIECVSGLSHWGRETYKRELMSNPSSIMLVARNLNGFGDRKILAFLASWVVADEMHINNIATHPDFRRCGIAGELLSEGLAIGRMYGAQFCILEVRLSNLPAQRLYSKMGFTVVGRRNSYYANPIEDALVMRKTF